MECYVWTPNTIYGRRHVQTYTYEKPGSYAAPFNYGPLDPATVKAVVR